MENKEFIMSCSSPVDVDASYFMKRNVRILYYHYMMDDVEHEDIMGRNKEELHQFFESLKNGKRSFTSQIAIDQYIEYFEELLKENLPILHIELGTGMTNSTINALKAVTMIKEKHPEAQIDVIDSLCSSSGYGLLVDYALDLRDEGKSMDEIEAWVIDHRNQVHHQFFCTDLSYFKRSGRITMMTAFFGSIMKACPIMKLNKDGKIIVYNKAFGRKNAIRKTVEEVMKHIQNGKDYQGKLWINGSDVPEMVETVRQALIQEAPGLEDKIRIWDIGTIIGSHCGPGTVAIYFLGDERE